MNLSTGRIQTRYYHKFRHVVILPFLLSKRLTVSCHAVAASRQSAANPRKLKNAAFCRKPLRPLAGKSSELSLFAHRNIAKAAASPKTPDFI
jgi:hypothetical protein